MKLFFSSLLFLGFLAGFSSAEHPAFKVESINIESGKDAQVGGIDIMPNGNIAVAFHEGDIRLYDPETQTWSLFASGLHEPLGLVAEDNHTVTVVQRPELTKISDSDKDGVADRYETLCDDFGMSGNYHEFAFGPVKDKQGNYFLSLNVASNGAPIRKEIRGDWLEIGLPRNAFYGSREAWNEGVKNKAGRMYSRVPYRGWVMKVDGKTGEMTPWASGLRSPNGLGFDTDGKLYVSDNQGDWLGTSKLFHIEQGKFYGHPASLPWTKGYQGPAPLELSLDELEDRRTPAAVWFTQGTMANSPTQPILIPKGFGAFGGQMLIGEMNKARIIRLMLEDVNGVTQGACTPLIDGQGLDMGINRFVFDGPNSLILGSTHLSWPGGEGLAKLTFSGENSFQDIKNIAITADGFELEFLQAVDPATLQDIRLKRYTFDYHSKYGSGQNDTEDLAITFSPVGKSGTKFTAALSAEHKKDFCYEFNFPMCQNPLLCYTVREIPVATAAAGTNENWVDLLANDSLELWRNGSKTSRDKYPTVGEQWSVKDGTLVLDKTAPGRGGHIITKADDYYNFELQFEFLISVEGNSGVKYRVNPETVGLEYQVYDDVKFQGEKNSLASLYNLKAATADKVANEPGKEWNTGRIQAVGNTLKHWLNGKLVMEIEFGSDEWVKTFNKSKYNVDPAFARAPGPILLQDHGDAVKFRKLMIRELIYASKNDSAVHSSEPQKVVPSEPLIREAKFNSTNTYVVVPGGVRKGAKLWTDRSYKVRKLPDALIGGTLIQTPMVDRKNRNGDIISFELLEDCDVYVAMKASNPHPAWITSWEKTGEFIEASNQLACYRKSFAKGATVVLDNPESLQAMYSAIVVKTD